MRKGGLRVNARSLAAVATALMCIGCTAPAALESQSPSDTPAVSASPSASATAVPPPSATSNPSATPAPAIAFEAPNGILPPESRAVVVVDALQLRAGPGLSESVIATLSATTVVELDWTGPATVDGLDWYLLSSGDQNGFAVAESGGDRYLELAPPRCVEPEADLAALTNITAWERLACFGDRSMTVVGTYGCPVCGSYLPGTYSPEWLAPGRLSYLTSSQDARPLVLHFAPDSGLQAPPNASIVRATGHFNDPAATTCVFTPPEDLVWRVFDPLNSVLYCREQFVVDSYEVIGTDPDFQYPAP